MISTLSTLALILICELHTCVPGAPPTMYPCVKPSQPEKLPQPATVARVWECTDKEVLDLARQLSALASKVKCLSVHEGKMYPYSYYVTIAPFKSYGDDYMWQRQGEYVPAVFFENQILVLECNGETVKADALKQIRDLMKAHARSATCGVRNDDGLVRIRCELNNWIVFVDSDTNYYPPEKAK